MIACALAAGCKTAVEKRCDALFDRYDSCSGRELADRMLGHEPAPTDQGNLGEIAYRSLGECSALTECGALEACFTAHECRWLVTGPTDDAPAFSCWK